MKHLAPAPRAIVIALLVIPAIAGCLGDSASTNKQIMFLEDPEYPGPPGEELNTDNHEDSDVNSTSNGSSPVKPTSAAPSSPLGEQGRSIVFHPTVVIAQTDTGINPFHPCWRTNRDPRLEVPELPRVEIIEILEEETYSEALAVNSGSLAALAPSQLYWINGTRIMFYPGTQPNSPIGDDDHGSHMSTIAACEDYGFGGDAWYVALQGQNEGLGSPNGWTDQMYWIAKQEWIDIVPLAHGSLYPTPVVDTEATEAVQAVVDSGRLVVAANGNGAGDGGPAFPGEWQETTNAKGVLAVGANDNNGWIYYSNFDPHVVSDGYGTPAGEHQGYETETSGGTSAASARVGGYSAKVLLEARIALNETGRDARCLIKTASPPEAGPIADGCLDAADLHEVIRKTADPASHESRFDGEDYGARAVPIPAQPPELRYPFLGYGEVSEHTLDAAVAVVLGIEPMPDRSAEDRIYELSEQGK